MEDNANDAWNTVKEFVYVTVAIILSHRIVWSKDEPDLKKEDDLFYLKVTEKERVNQMLNELIREKGKKKIYIYLYTKTNEEEEEKIRIIEKWCIQFAETRERINRVRFNTEQKARVVLRSIYSTMKLLPAYKLYKYNKQNETSQNPIYFDISGERNKKLEKRIEGNRLMAIRGMTEIESSVTEVKCNVKYCQDVTIPQGGTDYKEIEGQEEEEYMIEEKDPKTIEITSKSVPTSTFYTEKKTTLKPIKTKQEQIIPMKEKNIYKPYETEHQTPMTAPTSVFKSGARPSPYPIMEQVKENNEGKMKMNSQSPHFPLSYGVSASLESTGSDHSYLSGTPPIKYASTKSKRLPPPMNRGKAFDSPTMNHMHSSSAPKEKFKGETTKPEIKLPSTVAKGTFIGLDESQPKYDPLYETNDGMHEMGYGTKRLLQDESIEPFFYTRARTPMSDDETDSYQNDEYLLPTRKINIPKSPRKEHSMLFGEHFDEEDVTVDTLLEKIKSCKDQQLFMKNTSPVIKIETTLARLNQAQNQYSKEIIHFFDALS